MDDYVLVISLIVVLVGIISLIFTLRAAHLQNRKDDNSPPQVVRHKIMLNPVLWSYVAMVVLLVIGSYFFYMLFYA